MLVHVGTILPVLLWIRQLGSGALRDWRRSGSLQVCTFVQQSLIEFYLLFISTIQVLIESYMLFDKAIKRASKKFGGIHRATF